MSDDFPPRYAYPRPNNRLVVARKIVGRHVNDPSKETTSRRAENREEVASSRWERKISRSFTTTTTNLRLSFFSRDTVRQRQFHRNSVAAMRSPRWKPKECKMNGEREGMNVYLSRIKRHTLRDRFLRPSSRTRQRCPLLSEG